MSRAPDHTQILTPAHRVAVDVLQKHDVVATRGNDAIVNIELYERADALYVTLGSEHFTDTFTGGIERHEACGFQTVNLDCIEQLGHALIAAAQKARATNVPDMLAANIAAAKARAARRAKRGGSR